MYLLCLCIRDRKGLKGCVAHEVRQVHLVHLVRKAHLDCQRTALMAQLQVTCGKFDVEMHHNYLMIICSACFYFFMFYKFFTYVIRPVYMSDLLVYTLYLYYLY